MTLPPLRKRIEDIPLLIDTFTNKFNDQFGTNVHFGADAIQELLKYSFPGNVRELLNIIERCIALASGKIIGQNDLPAHILQNQKDKVHLLSLQQVSVEAEKNHIVRILSMTQGNPQELLRFSALIEKTLWEKINNYNLNV